MSTETTSSPAADPVGTVRSDPIAGEFIRLYDQPYTTAAPWLRLGGGPADVLWFTDAEVEDLEVIGAVPGSSAAIAAGWTAADVPTGPGGPARAALLRAGTAPHDCEFALGGARWAAHEYGVRAVLRCGCGKRWQVVGSADRGYAWVRRYWPTRQLRN